MMRKIGKAFCPGHVTGFFEICDTARDLRKKGSRGAGICLSKGVLTTIEITNSNVQSIEIFLNNQKSSAPTTRTVVKKLIKNKKYKVKVNSEIQLPMGQGFGMSGAGALSTSMALKHALKLDLSSNEIVGVAHEAEIKAGTGLGDVAAQSVGGITVRKKPGVPPYGLVEKIISMNREVVLCIVGKEIRTKSIITNESHRKIINRYGLECVEKFIRNPTIENLFNLSYDFTVKTKLAGEKILKAINNVKDENCGMASMSMLGNSVFATGDTKKLVDILGRFGETCVCSIDNDGARIIE